MDINVKLYLPFVVALNKMKVKYGEDFERLNGKGSNYKKLYDIKWEIW